MTSTFTDLFYKIITFNRQKDNETMVCNNFITHALFIDSTWNQSKGILKDSMISGKIFYEFIFIQYKLFITTSFQNLVTTLFLSSL